MKALFQGGNMLKIKNFRCGALLANGYVVYHKNGGGCLIIDPGYEPKKYFAFIKEEKLTPEGIILTHHHSDHTGAAPALKSKYGCDIYMHELDAFVYKDEVDVLLKDGQVLDFEGEELKILRTPGHTKGSICIYSENSRVCFSGDTLFDTDLGRSDLADGNEDEMRQSIINVLDKLENDVMIYSGHEGEANMKFIRRYNREFIALRDGRDR